MEKWEKMELHAVIIGECVGHYNGLHALHTVAIRPESDSCKKELSREQVTFWYDNKKKEGKNSSSFRHPHQTAKSVDITNLTANNK